MSEFPPAPERLVDIGGCCLHLNCAGEGSPLIILDAGLGDSNLVWAIIQPRLAEITRVCSYDRAGIGWSDPGQKPRTYQRAAEELNALLLQRMKNHPSFSLGIRRVRTPSVSLLTRTRTR